jgi:hypothetical protein
VKLVDEGLLGVEIGWRGRDRIAKAVEALRERRV